MLFRSPTIIQLLQYDAVIWSAPFDAPGVVGASDVLSRYLAAGRSLLLTGQSIAFYDGGGNLIYHPYFARVNALYKAKNFGASGIVGAAGGPLEGKTIPFTQVAGALAPDLVTVLRPENGQLIGRYTNAVSDDPGGLGGAGVWAAQCVKWRSAYYAFGLEAIGSVGERAEVISRTLNAFVAPRPALGLEMLSRDGYPTQAGIGLPGSTITHVVRLRNTGDGGTAQTVVLEASGNQWDTRLSSTSVTLEPCAMCAGAIVLARIDRLVFGTADPKAGACGTLFNIVQDPRLNHRVEVVGGVLGDVCADTLKSFFARRREK